MNISTSFNKFFIALLSFIVAAGGAVLGATGSSGLPQNTLMIITAVVAGASAVLVLATGNKNQPTLPPNSVVVDRSDVIAGSPVIAAHKP